MTASSRRDRPRLLCVDDDRSVLDGLARVLRHDYDVTTAGGGREAVAALDSPERFAIVMSDMRMPGIDGVTVLAEAERLQPDAVRVLLTGFADLEAAIAAINRARIFRFLCKPCDRNDLLDALDACVEQYRLVTAKRELLEQTLRGSIDTLLETLALANPIAFARATRIARTVSTLIQEVGAPDGWRIEVAAMLSQIGAVTLPPAVTQKLHDGGRLTPEEQRMVDALPRLADQLLAAIPRLEGVRLIIRSQVRDYGGGTPGAAGSSAAGGAAIPVGARILRLAVDLDVLEARGFTRREALEVLAARGRHDPRLIDALTRLEDTSDPVLRMEEVTVAELRLGMVLARDVRDAAGVLLVGRGHTVTPGLRERVKNWATAARIEEPLYVEPIERRGPGAFDPRGPVAVRGQPA